MFHLEEVIQLKDEENVKTLVRRHPMTLVPGLLLATVLIVAPFFFLFPLFNLGIIGVVLFLLAVVIGVVIAARTVILWDADVLVVTTLRVVDVDQRGVFSRFVTEVPISSIQDVSWKRQGIVDTIFSIGTLSIQTVGNQKPLEVPRIAHPVRLLELLSDLRHATTPRRNDLAPDHHERLKKIMALLGDLPPEALDRVEAAIRSEGRSQAVEGFLKKE